MSTPYEHRRNRMNRNHTRTMQVPDETVATIAQNAVGLTQSDSEKPTYEIFFFDRATAETVKNTVISEHARLSTRYEVPTNNGSTALYYFNISRELWDRIIAKHPDFGRTTWKVGESDQRFTAVVKTFESLPDVVLPASPPLPSRPPKQGPAR